MKCSHTIEQRRYECACYLDTDADADADNADATSDADSYKIFVCFL